MNLNEVDVQLGTAIRRLRHRQGRTLVEVARATGLSHPFLSQVERGRARPSMRSLFLIAEALGTTQQTLLAAASPAPATTPSGNAPLLGEGTRLLLHSEGVDVTEFSEIGTEYEEFFTHARPEFLYVVTGTLELETREPDAPSSTFTTLHPRDSATYPGNTQHRFRRLSPEPCVILLIHGDHHTR